MRPLPLTPALLLVFSGLLRAAPAPVVVVTTSMIAAAVHDVAGDAVRVEL